MRHRKRHESRYSELIGDNQSAGSCYACVMERNLFTKESRPPSDPADSPLSYTYIFTILQNQLTLIWNTQLYNTIKRRSLYTPLCLESRLRVFVYDTISTPAPAFPPRNDGAIVSRRRVVSRDYIRSDYSLSLAPLFSFFFLLLRLHCKICTTLRPAVAAELVRTGGSSLFHAL